MEPTSNELIDCDESIIDRVLTAATQVHRELGPGLLESVYEAALLIELREAGLHAESQLPIPVAYRGNDLGVGFRADVIVERQLLLELKSVRSIDDAHLATTINYLKLLRYKRGFILNFNVPLLKQGIRRVSI